MNGGASHNKMPVRIDKYHCSVVGFNRFILKDGFNNNFPYIMLQFLQGRLFWPFLTRYYGNTMDSVRPSIPVLYPNLCLTVRLKIRKCLLESCRGKSS